MSKPNLLSLSLHAMHTMQKVNSSYTCNQCLQQAQQSSYTMHPSPIIILYMDTSFFLYKQYVINCNKYSTISSTKSHSQSWYRNRNNKRFLSLPRRKYPRRSQRLALITKAKTFTHPPECMPVATSQSSIDANVTYGFSNNKNRELRHIPNGASFKEYHVNNVLHFR